MLLVEAPPPTLRRARARRGPTSPARPTRGDVAAKFRLSIDADRRGRRGRAAGRGRARRAGARRRPTSTSARARPPPRGSASSPPGSRPATAGRTSSCPTASASCCSSISRLPAPPRPRAVGLGLRADRRAHAGPEGAVRGRVGHRQDDGRAGARRRARPRDLPRRPRDDRVASTSARPRRTSTGSSAPPRAPTRSSSSTRPTRCSASARRSSDSHDRYANIEVAYLLQKMEGYPGAVILATNFRRNIDDAFVRRLDFVIDFPFPEAEDRRADLAARCCPHEAPLRRRRRPRLPGASSSSSRAARSATARCRRLPGRRRRRRDRDAPPRARRRAGVRQAGPAHARGGLRALPRADPRGAADARAAPSATTTSARTRSARTRRPRSPSRSTRAP